MEDTPRTDRVRDYAITALSDLMSVVQGRVVDIVEPEPDTDAALVLEILQQTAVSFLAYEITTPTTDEEMNDEKETYSSLEEASIALMTEAEILILTLDVLSEQLTQLNKRIQDLEHETDN